MAKRRALSALLLGCGLLHGFGLLQGAAYAEGNAGLYARCAACHLPNGEGVPRIYPPLKGNLATFFATPTGRDYLAQAVVHGVRGTIQVDGITYRGVMASVVAGLSAKQLAELMNELVSRFGSPTQKADGAVFTEAQMRRVMASKVKDILSLRSNALAAAAE